MQAQPIVPYFPPYWTALYGISSCVAGFAIGGVWGLVQTNSKHPSVKTAANILLSPLAGFLRYVSDMQRIITALFPNNGKVPILPLSLFALMSDRVALDLIDIYFRGFCSGVIGQLLPKGWLSLVVRLNQVGPSLSLVS